MYPSPARSAYGPPSIDGLTSSTAPAPSVEICMLGGFRLLGRGEPILARAAGKVELLLSSLALGHRHGVPRETLLNVVWPESEPSLAGQSLNSLVYNLRRVLSDHLGNQAPIVSDAGGYRLNLEAGISVDVLRFDALVLSGDQRRRNGDASGAAERYAEAVDLYRGDLCAAGAPTIAIERERLRASYLMALAHLADFHLGQGDWLTSLAFAQALLRGDPCREDALRLVMRCYVRLGERAQALRHFRLTESILREEFAAEPEPATIELWEQVRMHPESVR